MARPKSELAAQGVQRDYVGTKDAAAILGVSVSTIQKMVARGALKAWRTDGGHRRIALDDLRNHALDVGIDAVISTGREERRAEVSFRPLRILLVEDNRVTVKALEKHFARLDDRVQLVVCADAAEALLKIAERTPDLLVTDLAMQPFDGFHLLRVLRSSDKYRHLPVIVLTGMSDAEITARGGLDARVTLYHKPVSADRLLGFLDAMLQARHGLLT
jgi:excisionase family DNA binding protein